jgi:hypothetical protein
MYVPTEFTNEEDTVASVLAHGIPAVATAPPT